MIIIIYTNDALKFQCQFTKFKLPQRTLLSEKNNGIFQWSSTMVAIPSSFVVMTFSVFGDIKQSNILSASGTKWNKERNKEIRNDNYVILTGDTLGTLQCTCSHALH